MKEIPIHSVFPGVLFLLVLGFLTWKVLSFVRPRNQHTLRSVAVLVLGDIGRSPRMMYHAKSFAENDFETDLIGYGGMLSFQVVSSALFIPLHRLKANPSTRTASQTSSTLSSRFTNSPQKTTLYPGWATQSFAPNLRYSDCSRVFDSCSSRVHSCSGETHMLKSP